MANGVDIPKPGSWPGALESFKLVRTKVKPRIWDFIYVIGVSIVIFLIADIILTIIFKHNAVGRSIVEDVVNIIIAAFLEATVISMYFAVLEDKDFSVQSVMNYGLTLMPKLIALIIVLYVIVIASLIALVIPFFFIFPRVYLAPYYLVRNNCTVGEAIAASWHSAKGHVWDVYGVILLGIAIALLFITIVGIPFAIYWGIINYGSFALLVLYLSQPKHKKQSAKT